MFLRRKLHCALKKKIRFFVLKLVDYLEAAFFIMAKTDESSRQAELKSLLLQNNRISDIYPYVC